MCPNVEILKKYRGGERIIDGMLVLLDCIAYAGASKLELEMYFQVKNIRTRH